MTSYERVEKVILYIEAHRAEQPNLSVLAKVAGLSESRFHRLFTRWAGTTPKSFLKFLTSEHAKELLRSSRDLLGASLEAGLSGPGRLHDLLVTVEGVTPGEFKSGGAGVVIRHGFVATPFGPALIGLTERGVCHLSFPGQNGREKALARLRRDWPKARKLPDARAAATAAAKIFGSGSRTIPVVLRGTPFQLQVWRALLRVPPGRLATYGQVAAAVGRARATRAVGTAVGSNAIAWLIPCHRVLRGSGALGGYRWGPARKSAMLAWESARAAADGA